MFFDSLPAPSSSLAEIKQKSKIESKEEQNTEKNMKEN